jgi:hypothetical protein
MRRITALINCQTETSRENAVEKKKTRINTTLKRGYEESKTNPIWSRLTYCGM